MRILLFNPDNGVTRNFMPHLWMFLLKALTPPEHEVFLIDGNAQRMDVDGISQYVRDQKIDLVGIGAMTRMIQKAYRMADAIRAAGVPVVMGGPHVTEEPDEALVDKTVEGALQAITEYHRQRPDRDLSSLYQPIEEITRGSNNALRVEAQKTSAALGQK